MPKILSLHQPNYLPWIGYFYKIASSDVFVFLDNVQFPQGKTVANHSKIRTKNGEIISLSVPIRKESGRNYNEIFPDETQKWRIKHLKTIQQHYGKTPFFNTHFPPIKKIFAEEQKDFASLNISFISYFLSQLDIKTEVHCASAINFPVGKKSQRVVDICKYFNSDIYLSGKGAQKYNDEKLYNDNGIALKYSDFIPITYSQNGQDFIPNLSIIDLLFNCNAEQAKSCLTVS